LSHRLDAPPEELGVSACIAGSHLAYVARLRSVKIDFPPSLPSHLNQFAARLDVPASDGVYLALASA
jgi:hypothetical protein